VKARRAKGHWCSPGAVKSRLENGKTCCALVLRIGSTACCAEVEVARVATAYGRLTYLQLTLSHDYKYVAYCN
jgi:hypothetical protein